MNLDSINKKYILATFKSIAPILLLMCMGILYFTIKYTSEEKEREAIDTKRMIESYHSSISEKIAILTSSNIFIDFIRSGEISRDENLLDIKILFSNLKDSSIKGLILFSDEKLELFRTGHTSDDFVSLKLCYLNDFLNTKLGSCRFILKVFFDLENLASILSQKHSNIQICADCKVPLFGQSKSFGSFDIADFKDSYVPIKIKSRNELNSILLFFILFILLIGFVSYTMHRTFKSISENYLYSPIKNIVESLNNGRLVESNNLQINEIKFLANSVNSYIANTNEQENLRRKASLGELATQVAHDLRSPIEILRSTRSDLSSLTEFTRTSLNIGITRLEEITNTLLNHHKLDVVTRRDADMAIHALLPIIKSAIQEKRIEYKDKEVEFFENYETNSENYFSNFNRTSFKNVISNLINNSIESFNIRGKVYISLNSRNEFNTLSIKDDGNGIPEHILAKLFTKGFTTKKYGNGLGLYSAINEIKSFDGRIELESKEYEGTTIHIHLPALNQLTLQDQDSTNHTVLIDDDKFIRFHWEGFFQKQNQDIKTFCSVNHFIENCDTINRNSFIFVDSNLGNLLKGEFESEKIHQLGFRNIFLSTGYNPDTITQPTWIKNICSKSPADAMSLINSSEGNFIIPPKRNLSISESNL